MTTVVFDLGVVLSSEGDLIEILAERVGVPADLLGPAYWADRQAYDDGQPDLEYWRGVLEPLGVPVDEALADELTFLDGAMWTDIRPEAEQILRELHERAVPVYVLSNAPASMARSVEQADWRELIDGFVVSGVLGHSKPEPEIYAAVEALAGVGGDALAFIDDRRPNVVGAKEAGWRAHLWSDDADTRAWLSGLGVL